VMHPVGFMYKKDETVNVQANDMRFGNHKLNRAQIKILYLRPKRESRTPTKISHS